MSTVLTVDDAVPLNVRLIIPSVTNTDDFLVRMVKGCIQLGCRPDITNSINMVPVDRIARIVVASVLHPPVSPLGVVHGTSIQRLRFNDFLGAVEAYGYRAPQVPYSAWRKALEDYVADTGREMHALYIPTVLLIVVAGKTH